MNIGDHIHVKRSDHDIVGIIDEIHAEFVVVELDAPHEDGTHAIVYVNASSHQKQSIH